MKKFSVLIILVMFAWLAPVNTLAKNRASTVYSPHCNEAKVKLLAKDGLVYITVKSKNKKRPTHFFIILDTKKLTFIELKDRMRMSGCF